MPRFRILVLSAIPSLLVCDFGCIRQIANGTKQGMSEFLSAENTKAIASSIGEASGKNPFVVRPVTDVNDEKQDILRSLFLQLGEFFENSGRRDNQGLQESRVARWTSEVIDSINKKPEACLRVNDEGVTRAIREGKELLNNLIDQNNESVRVSFKLPSDEIKVNLSGDVARDVSEASRAVVCAAQEFVANGARSTVEIQIPGLAEAIKPLIPEPFLEKTMNSIDINKSPGAGFLAVAFFLIVIVVSIGMGWLLPAGPLTWLDQREGVVRIRVGVLIVIAGIVAGLFVSSNQIANTLANYEGWALARIENTSEPLVCTPLQYGLQTRFLEFYGDGTSAVVAVGVLFFLARCVQVSPRGAISGRLLKLQLTPGGWVPGLPWTWGGR